jgi:hypothetical protein
MYKRRVLPVLSDPDFPARAYCVGPDALYADSLVCSGRYCAELDGRPCRFAEQGRMPHPVPLREDDPLYSIDKGQPGDLCPPCMDAQLTSLSHWQGHGGQIFPEQFLPLRLFKCSISIWWVLPGLYDATPSLLIPNDLHDPQEPGG